jgi:hypothetical protein
MTALKLSECSMAHETWKAFCSGCVTTQSQNNNWPSNINLSAWPSSLKGLFRGGTSGWGEDERGIWLWKHVRNSQRIGDPQVFFIVTSHRLFGLPFVSSHPRRSSAGIHPNHCIALFSWRECIWIALSHDPSKISTISYRFRYRSYPIRYKNESTLMVEASPLFCEDRLNAFQLKVKAAKVNPSNPCP